MSLSKPCTICGVADSRTVYDAGSWHHRDWRDCTRALGRQLRELELLQKAEQLGEDVVDLLRECEEWLYDAAEEDTEATELRQRIYLLIGQPNERTHIDRCRCTLVDHNREEDGMRYRLKRDIVIPAGTVFGQAPVRTERVVSDEPYDGSIETIIGLTRDSFGSLVYSLDPADREALGEWFEELGDGADDVS